MRVETYKVCRPYWALLWRSRNKLDGKREYILFNSASGRPLLFDTRKEAMAYRREKYGYIRNRQDLRREPHGWRMPLPIKVSMVFKYAAP